MTAESTVMEDVSTPAPDEWLRRTAQTRNIGEYLRKKKPLKISPCKKGSASFFGSVIDSPATRAARLGHYKTAPQCVTKTQVEEALVRGLAVPIAVINTEARFHRLADEWSRDTGSVSSVTALTSHPKYQGIIDLGWPVVPYLLADLKERRGFWFHALLWLPSCVHETPQAGGLCGAVLTADSVED